MSNPSFSNIDRWLFELVEGNLTAEQEAQLKAFLLLHPELENDLDAWEEAYVSSNHVEFENKAILQKKRPVGLYMSLSFIFMFGLLIVGVYSQLLDLDGLYTKSEISGISELNNLFSKVDRKTSEVKSDSQRHVQKQLWNKHLKSGDRLSATMMVGGNNSVDVNAINNFTGSTYIVSGSSDENSSADCIEGVVQKKQYEIFIASSREIVKTALRTRGPKPLSMSSGDSKMGQSSLNSTLSNRKFAKSNYHRSLSARVHSVARSMSRMLDNPIALRNMNDPYFHVPGMQAMDINFGAVGALLSTRVQSTSRAQWLGFGNQQWINRLSFDGYSYAMRGGFGFQFDHNYYGKGEIQNYSGSFTYSPKFSVSRNVVLEPSVRFKMGSKQLAAGQITAGEVVEYDRSLQQQFNNAVTPGTNLWYRDLGLGLMVNTRWFYAGIQQDNLFRHYDNIYSKNLTELGRAPRHFVACVGSDYKSIRQKFTVSPYIVYQKQDKFSEAWAGVNLRLHWLAVGGAVSSNLEPAASIGIHLKHFMLKYNADLTHSYMFGKPLLSHQISLRFITKSGRVAQRLLNE